MSHSHLSNTESLMDPSSSAFSKAVEAIEPIDVKTGDNKGEENKSSVDLINWSADTETDSGLSDSDLESDQEYEKTKIDLVQQEIVKLQSDMDTMEHKRAAHIQGDLVELTAEIRTETDKLQNPKKMETTKASPSRSDDFQTLLDNYYRTLEFVSGCGERGQGSIDTAYQKLVDFVTLNPAFQSRLPRKQQSYDDGSFGMASGMAQLASNMRRSGYGEQAGSGAECLIQ